MKKILLILLILIILPLITSAPPVTTTQQFAEGFAIEESPAIYLKLNQDHTYNFFLFNLSNGLLVDNATTNCTFYLSDDTGELIFSDNVIYNNTDKYWSLNISGQYFNKIDDYYHGTFCQSDYLGGTQTGTWTITPTGHTYLDQAQSILIVSSFIIMMLVAGFFCFIGFKLDKWYLKIIFCGLSSIVLVMIIMFSLLTLDQNIANYQDLVEGYSTFWFFIKIIISVSVTSLLLFVMILAWFGWKKTRGILE